MPLPIISFDPILANSVRGLAWSLKKTEQWKTIRQEANRRVVKLPQYNNPLFQWELKWGYVNDGWPGAIQPTQQSNVPYSDFKVLRSLYFQAKGQGNEFYFQPPDAIVAGQAIPAPDANNNSEVVHTYGGYPLPFTTFNLAVTNVVILNNVLTVTVSSLSTLAVGMGILFAGIGTATFLNNQTVQVTSIKPGSVTFSAPFAHANYSSTPDTGTASVVSYMQPVNESVQVLAGGALTSIFVNGSAASNYTLAAPSTVAPYDGYVIQWNSTGGSIPVSTDSIIANYTYYYDCEFGEDSLEYENFMPYLWKVGALKFQQVGL